MSWIVMFILVFFELIYFTYELICYWYFYFTSSSLTVSSWPSPMFSGGPSMVLECRPRLGYRLGKWKTLYQSTEFKHPSVSMKSFIKCPFYQCEEHHIYNSEATTFRKYSLPSFFFRAIEFNFIQFFSNSFLYVFFKSCLHKDLFEVVLERKNVDP